MSKLDEYKTAKAEHETICEIIAICKPSVGDISQHSSAHHIGFLFRLPGIGLRGLSPPVGSLAKKIPSGRTVTDGEGSIQMP